MSLTPMMQQYMETKSGYPDAILFYRLGDFYEMFFEDAKVASRELELTLTGKDCGLDERAPMCGVPFHSAEAYISRLVAKGYKVVICEQVEDPKLAKGLVKREVVRILTPGTITESTMLNESKNNYLCAILFEQESIGLCFCDVSTGDFHATVIHGEDRQTRLINELGSFLPAEILINRMELATKEFLLFCRERLCASVEGTRTELFTPELCEKTFHTQMSEYEKNIRASAQADELIHVVGALLLYIQETQKTSFSYVKTLKVYSDRQYLEIDINTRRNLELCATMRTGEKRGSLLGVLDRTKTAMGSRLLRQWIEMPLRSVKDIVQRQKTIHELAEDYLLREELGEALKDILDLERLMTRVVYGTANARDLRAIGNTLQVLPTVKRLLLQNDYPQMRAIADSIDELTDITSLIDRAIEDSPPVSVREGGMIRKGYHTVVDQLNEMVHNSKRYLEEMEIKEREETGIKTLKVGYNRVFGYYIEVSKSYLSQVPDHYIRKQTLSTGERYITQALKDLEATILGASDKIASLEYELFCAIREQIAGQTKRIQKSAGLLSLLDVYYSLATVAKQNHYVCPEVDDSCILSIKDGRHPVVEQFVTDQYFVPNDTELDIEDRRMMLITGPNMAGKSTYMRQTALIVLMAQMGSFVPAKEARVGIVDKLFTRVGASDDLASGQSTFMLEMNEVAYILKHATRQSLIVYDEIGRGTSTFDGMSIAQAVAEYTASKAIGAKTLFATHYHELTEMANATPGMINYHIAAKKKEDTIIFLRKIVAGAADDSYGIEVAKLAGIPNDVIKKAKSILAKIEKDVPVTVVKQKATQPQVENDNISFASLEQEALISAIREIDINQLTPLEAMNLIYAWKQQAKNFS